jgi:hypothetical protein
MGTRHDEAAPRTLDNPSRLALGVIEAQVVEDPPTAASVRPTSAAAF